MIDGCKRGPCDFFCSSGLVTSGRVTSGSGGRAAAAAAAAAAVAAGPVRGSDVIIVKIDVTNPEGVDLRSGCTTCGNHTALFFKSVHHLDRL